MGGSLLEQLAQLDGHQKTLGAELGTDKPYQAFIEAHHKLATSAAGFDTVLASQSDQLDKLITLLSASTEGSNLTLDPDIDTYYLMDATMFRLPLVIEYVSQLGELGAGMLKTSPANPAQVRKATELIVLANGRFKPFAMGWTRSTPTTQTRKPRLMPKMRFGRPAHS